MVYLIGGCIAFIVSVLLVPKVRQAAIYVGAVDRPDARKIHRKLMPRMGGLAVFAGIVAGLSCALLATRQGWWGISNDFIGSDRIGQLPYLLAGSLVVLGVGIYDDIFGVTPKTKLFFQAVAACVLFYGGIHFGGLFLPLGLSDIVLIQLALTVAWLLACSNAVNLIDGMDGLASGVSLIATATLFVMAAHGLEGPPNTYLATVMACFAGALLGFLIFNFHPAVIFLGDTGSLFLGFAIGAFALQQQSKASTMVALAIPILVLGLPIADTTLAILRRWGKRQSFSTPDKSHLHHRLLGLGFSQKQAVLILYAVCVMLSALAVMLISMDPMTRGIMGVLAGLILVAVWAFGGGEFAATRRRIRETLGHGRRTLRRERAVKAAAMAMESAEGIEPLWEAFLQGIRRLAFDYVELRLSDEAGAAFDKRHFTWAGQRKRNGDEAWRGRYRLHTAEGQSLATLNLARHGQVGDHLAGTASALTLELEQMLNRLAGHPAPEPSEARPPLKLEVEGSPTAKPSTA